MRFVQFLFFKHALGQDGHKMGAIMWGVGG